MNESTIIRTVKDKKNPYTMVNATFANDERLSWEARGVMAYLLTKPDNWQVYPKNLIKRGLSGRDEIYRILKELELCGYLLRFPERNEEGKITGWTYLIHEVPEHLNPIERPERKRAKKPHAEIPEVDGSGPKNANPHPDLPDTDCPDTENPYMSNKEGELTINPNLVSTTTPEPIAADASGGGGTKGETASPTGDPPPSSPVPLAPPSAKQPENETAVYLRRIVDVKSPKVRDELAHLPLAGVQAAWESFSGGAGAFVEYLRANPPEETPPAAPEADDPNRPPWAQPDEWAGWRASMPSMCSTLIGSTLAEDGTLVGANELASQLIKQRNYAAQIADSRQDQQRRRA